MTIKGIMGESCTSILKVVIFGNRPKKEESSKVTGIIIDIKAMKLILLK